MRLLDGQLEVVASSLIASGLSLDLIQNLESSEDLINDLLGEERVDKIINIYSVDGEALTRNLTAFEFSLPFDPDQQRVTYTIDGRTVRVLNLKEKNLVIQVGVIFNDTLESWSILNSRFGIFIFLIVIILLATAFFASRMLFQPLRKLTLELEMMSHQLDHKLGQPLTQFTIGQEFSKLSHSAKRNKDEFEQLCFGVDQFLKKLESYTKSFNGQIAILTHELKTPLTILKSYLSEAQRLLNEESKEANLIHRSQSEIDHLATLINNYLQWSLLVSNPGNSDLYAVKLIEISHRVVEGLNKTFGGRVRMEGTTNLVVFCLPSHLEQLLSNILLNALKYSPQDQIVVLHLTNDGFCVEDQGFGIEISVLEHLGSPFNRGSHRTASERSSGLGLTWVHALCERYQWKLHIESHRPHGTEVTVAMG